MGILSGNPKKQPLHYGEIFGMWAYLVASKGSYAVLQTLMNHTGDRDLKSLLEELSKNAKQEEESVEEILKANGISLPPSPPERSLADVEEIPVGARFMDQEISAMVGAKLGEGLIACSTMISQCTREDVAMLFGQFHMNKAQAAAKTLRLNKSKGWLIHPPLHTNVPKQE